MKIAPTAAQRRLGLGLTFAALCAGSIGMSGVAGCSSSKSDTSSDTSGAGTSGVSGTSAATGSTTATLNPTAHAVKATPLSVADGTVTFPTDAEVQSFQVGDTILAADAATAVSTPYLRTITAIATDSPAAGQTTFTTTAATLDDVFASADVSQTGAITTGDAFAAAPIDAGDPNILDLPLIPGLPSTSSPLDLQILPSGSKLWSVGGSGANKGSFGLSGGAMLDTSESSLSVSGGVDFEYTKLPGLTLLPQHLRLVFSGGLNVTAGAKLSTTGALSYSLPTYSYAPEIPLGTIVFYAGYVPIPVVVTVGFDADATFALSTSAILHEAVTAALNMSAGVDYTSSGGATGVFTHTALINHAPFTVTGNVAGTFTLYPLEPVLHFRVLGIAGPAVSLSPYIGVQVLNPSGDAGTQVNGIYGLRSFLSGDLSIFNDKLAGLSITLFNLTGSFPSCAATSLVCSGGPIVGTSGK
jgi:hypothetical protein